MDVLDGILDISTILVPIVCIGITAWALLRESRMAGQVADLEDALEEIEAGWLDD